MNFLARDTSGEGFSVFLSFLLQEQRLVIYIFSSKSRFPVQPAGTPHCDWLSGSFLVQTEMTFSSSFHHFPYLWWILRKDDIVHMPSLNCLWPETSLNAVDKKCISKFVLHKPKGSLKIVRSAGFVLGISHISGSLHPLAYRKGS